MPSYDEFIAEWGNNVKQVTKYGGECVALVAEFESENGLPIVWGDAHQWINNPTMLGAYDWIANNPSDANQVPNRGDIIIWNLPNEHIAFFDTNLGNHRFQTYGQNSGGRLAHFAQHSWTSNPAGWYRRKHAAPAPVPPPAPTPVTHPYTIEVINPKQIRINKNTHRWGLNYDNLTAIVDNPEGGANAGDIISVNGLLHHHIGYNYYLPDVNTASGFNVLDCDDYTAPPVPKPEPTPLPKPPSGPVTAPSSETYEVIKDIPGYTNSSFAINHSGATTTVAAGHYYVFNRREPAINLTKKPGQPGSWINPSDNVPDMPPPPPPIVISDWPGKTEPEPEPVDERWKESYVPFENPDYYIAMSDITVPDLEGKHKDKLMPKYSTTVIDGIFYKNGIEYGRPKSGADKDWWYGVPMIDAATGLLNVELESDVFDTATSTADHKALKTLTTHDYLVLATAKFKELEGSFGKVWDVIRPKKRKK